VNAAKNQQREIESAEASSVASAPRTPRPSRSTEDPQAREDRADRCAQLGAQDHQVPLPAAAANRPGGREIKHVRKAYGDLIVYKRLDLVVERGEKIALVGPNGAGKSTLLKMLAGVIEPDSGTLQLGHSVRREYFASTSWRCSIPGQTVLKTMEEVAGPVGRLPEVRSYLGTSSSARTTSPSRWASFPAGRRRGSLLPGCSWTPGLLLLDEPTNHLDMDSRAILTEALRQFEGSVVFISHDRHLINAIGTKVIEVRDGKLGHYPGDWEYYLWKKSRRSDRSLSPAHAAGL